MWRGQQTCRFPRRAWDLIMKLKEQLKIDPWRVHEQRLAGCIQTWFALNVIHSTYSIGVDEFRPSHFEICVFGQGRLDIGSQELWTINTSSQNYPSYQETALAFSSDSAPKFRKTSVTVASGQYWWHPGRIMLLASQARSDGGGWWRDVCVQGRLFERMCEEVADGGGDTCMRGH